MLVALSFKQVKVLWPFICLICSGIGYCHLQGPSLPLSNNLMSVWSLIIILPAPCTQGSTLTLAQHYGLVPRPSPRFTQEQWEEVHIRSRLREHSNDECPICREDFKDEPQVIGCTIAHPYHRSLMISEFVGIHDHSIWRLVTWQKRQFSTPAVKLCTRIMRCERLGLLL